MAEILKINMETALHDPETAFGTPAALVRSMALTRGQKIATLQRWSYQVHDRLRAGDEGMPTRRMSSGDLALLGTIVSAIVDLRNGHADSAGK
jgi:hypothetical protein